MRLIDNMPRSDKKDTTCVCCGYKFTRPAKLRQHYKSNKNQCNQPPENNTNQRNAHIPLNIPRSRSPAPVIHVRERDRRKEVPRKVRSQSPTPTTQVMDQGNNQEGKYIDRHARKTGEHMKTWGARLRRRCTEIIGEECDLPKNLKEC